MQLDQQQQIDSWHQRALFLEELDQAIQSTMREDGFDETKLASLIAKRERLLQTLTDTLRRLPQLYQSVVWQQALARTTDIVEEMSAQTKQLRAQAHQVVRTQHSLKQYQRFS